MEKTKLIIGVHSNNTCGTYYWYLPKALRTQTLIGDYAIVQNMRDYALVKIVGIVETEPSMEHVVVGCSKPIKRVIYTLPANSIEGWRESLKDRNDEEPF